jgi:hypothetical protein
LPFRGLPQRSVKDVGGLRATSRLRNDFNADRMLHVRESAMGLGCYAVTKDKDKWTICAWGRRPITCGDRRTALATVRYATNLLRGLDGGGRRPAGPQRKRKLAPTAESRPVRHQIGGELE